MTFTLDITLILEVLLFLVVLVLAAYLLWPSRKVKGAGEAARTDTGAADTRDEATVTEQRVVSTIIHHYHYVIRMEDGKEVVEQETDSDMDAEGCEAYAATPDTGSWTRESMMLLRSLDTDPDLSSRARKIDHLIEIGMVSEQERESLMRARVDVSVEGPSGSVPEIEPDIDPDGDGHADDYGNPLPESGFIEPPQEYI